MLDIQLFRDTPELIREGLRKRSMDSSSVDQVVELDIKRRELIQKVETLRAERNTGSKEIGRAKDAAERQQKIEAMRTIGDRIDALSKDLGEVDIALNKLLATFPNIPDANTPLGADESENVILKTVGEIPSYDFAPKPHWDLGPEMGLIDFERGVKLTGSRFYVLNGDGARLQRALIAWMLDLHTRQGYSERYLPFVVKEETVFASGQLPKFEGNLYHDHEEDLWLVPTAEVPLTSLHRDEILDEESLPRNYTAYTACFRREKMSAGRDVRGIKRGHQFDKVEMYTFCKPEESEAKFQKMVRDAEQVCAGLGLPYRIKQLCTGDLGFAATITYDIEVWAAGCQEWLEVSSVSNVKDFQARRAAVRYRPEDGKGTRYVHTLNGSGLGLPRTLIAVLENYQQADGSIIIPEVLRPWMGGIEIICKK